MSAAWNPFPLDGRWTAPEHWREFEGLVDRPLHELLDPLERVFRTPWALEQAATGAHPLKRDICSRTRRSHLLRLGRALATLPPVSATLRKRLRNTDYDAASAELVVGLMLLESGAELEPERKSVRGPEWVARWADGTRVAVEVYRPHQSKAELDLTATGARVLWAAQEVLQPLPLSQAIYLSLDPSDSLMRECLTEAAARDLGVRMGQAILPLISPSTQLGWFDLGDLGAFETRPKPPGHDMLQINGRVAPGSDEHNLGRLERELLRKRKQIDATGLPGFVVIHWSELELGASSNVLPDLLRQVEGGDTWAGDLVGLGILREGCSRDLLVPSTTLDVVAGPRASEGLLHILLNLRICEHQHFHLDSPFRYEGEECPSEA